MTGIKSVIFDWGGVLLKDPAPFISRYCAGKLRVTLEEFRRGYYPVREQFQRGEILEKDMWKSVASELKVQEPKGSVWLPAFEGGYLEDARVFDMTKRLRFQGYQTALLSNTEFPTQKIFKKHEKSYRHLDHIFFSYEIGSRKPEETIFRIALEKLASQPEQSVFIDNEPEYIEGAKKIGMNTILFKDASQLERDLHHMDINLY